MEIRNEKVSINRKEMQEIKKMDHHQMERKLQEAYDAGYFNGKATGMKLAGERSEDIMKARKNAWQQAVRNTLDETKGIGPGRRELFLERLDQKLSQKTGPV